MAAEWINRRKDEAEKKKHDLYLEVAKEGLARQAIKTSGPVFWDSLLRELNTQCADMEDIGFQAMAYSLDNPYCLEEKTYRIDVQTKGHWPRDAHASLIYFTGSSLIRATSDIRKLTEISLSVTERGIRAVSNLELRQMDAEELASFLLKELVEAIEKRK